MRLLLIGCTGFIGRELIPRLLSSGHELIVISRKRTNQLSRTFPIANFKHIKIDPCNALSWKKSHILEALKNSEGIINLAGEPISEKRWTKIQCSKIEESRILTTKYLVDTLSKLQKAPKVLINGSAVGYYGTRNDDISLTEKNAPGDDFLARICKEWEKFASKKPRSTRLVIIRIGIVLESDGGALGKMLPIFRAGLGGPIGDGSQWMSWIHRTDLCKIIEKSISEKQWNGVINGVAPNPSQMNEFSNKLGKVLKRPTLLQVPGAVLKLILGDGATIVLEGQKVSSKKLETYKFKFIYPELTQALDSSLNTK